MKMNMPGHARWAGGFNARRYDPLRKCPERRIHPASPVVRPTHQSQRGSGGVHILDSLDSIYRARSLEARSLQPSRSSGAVMQNETAASHS